MSSLPCHLSISVLSVTTGEGEPELQCTLEMGGQSVSVGVPSEAVEFPNVSLEEDDIIQVSVCSPSKEIGRCMLKLGQLLKRDAVIDSEFLLARPSSEKQERLSSVYTPNKVRIRIEALDQPSIREKNYSEIENQSNKLRGMLHKSYESRQELQMWIKESSEQFSTHHAKQSELMKSTLSELSALKDSLLNEESHNKQVTSQNRRQNTKIRELKNLLNSATAHVVQFDSLTKTTETKSKLVEDSWQERNKIRDEYAHSVEEFARSSRTQESYREEICKENTDLRKKIKVLDSENSELKNKNESLNSKVISLTAEIAEINARLNLLLAQKQREKELDLLVVELQQANNELQETLSKLRESSNKDFEKLRQKNDDLLIDNKSLGNEIESLKEELVDSQNTSKNLKSEVQNLKANTLKLEEHICLQEDLNQMVEQLKSQNDTLHGHQSELLKDVNSLSDTVKAHEVTIAQARNSIKELETDKKNKEEEIVQLKGIIQALKNRREIYFPDKEDPVDIAVADYLNTTNPPLKVPISREDNGIYMFGTKRVFVKLEQGKLIFRVGGGFMQIEDFLEVYSPVELDKFESKLRGQAQQVRKSLYGKYANGMVTEKERSPSPQRSAANIHEVGNKYSTFYAVQTRKSPSPNRVSTSPNGKRRPQMVKNKTNFRDEP